MYLTDIANMKIMLNNNFYSQEVITDFIYFLTEDLNAMSCIYSNNDNKFIIKMKKTFMKKEYLTPADCETFYPLVSMVFCKVFEKNRDKLEAAITPAYAVTDVMTYTNMLYSLTCLSNMNFIEIHL